MRRRLSTIGVFVVVMMVVATGLVGCSRQAKEREPQATEPVSETGGLPSGGETAPAPGETVVSAVTPAPGTATEQTPGAVATATAVPIGETPAAAEPTAGVAPGEATAAPAPAELPSPSPGGTGSSIWHTVQPGDTLSSIALRYGTTWQAVAQANNLSNPNQIYVGQKLQIPTTSGDSSGGTTSGCRIRHTVKQGEWVWQIARSYGVSPYDILAANGLTIQSANTIYPGLVLCIP
jgi:LysM repeat protein